MRSDDKGKFQSEISQDVIDAAMKSVDKAKAAVQGVEVPVEAPPAPEAPAAEAAPEAAPEAAEAPAAPGDPRDKEIEELKTSLEMSLSRGRDLMGKIREEHEKMLRAAADLENYKKRAQKEKEEVQKFGVEKLLKELLPVVDNIDRALESTADLESLKKGVEMIRRSFTDALARHGVRSFSAKGQPFDPMRHEAISQAETTDMPPNHVFLEQLRGYTLNDRLVRPALVVVSRAPAAPEAPAVPPTDPAQPKT